MHLEWKAEKKQKDENNIGNKMLLQNVKFKHYLTKYRKLQYFFLISLKTSDSNYEWMSTVIFISSCIATMYTQGYAPVNVNPARGGGASQAAWRNSDRERIRCNPHPTKSFHCHCQNPTQKINSPLYDQMNPCHMIVPPPRICFDRCINVMANQS